MVVTKPLGILPTSQIQTCPYLRLRRHGRRLCWVSGSCEALVGRSSPVNTWVGGALERGHLSRLLGHLGFSLLLDSNSSRDSQKECVVNGNLSCSIFN